MFLYCDDSKKYIFGDLVSEDKISFLFFLQGIIKEILRMGPPRKKGE